MFNVSVRAPPDGDDGIAYSDVVVCPAWDGGSPHNVDRVPDGSKKSRQHWALVVTGDAHLAT